MMQVEVKSGTMTKDEIQYYILLVKKRWGTRLPADLRLILEKTDAEVQTAQAALDDFSACLDAVQSGGKSQALTSLSYYNGSSMHALYQANETLGKAIDQLYAKLQEQAADPMKMGAVQGQYGQFNSAGTIIGTLKYNEAVYNYQNEVGGFPANVLGGLAGVKEVEPFA